MMHQPTEQARQRLTERHRSNVHLPRLTKHSQPDLKIPMPSIEQKVRSLSIMNLKKVKLQQSHTDRRQSMQIQTELARLLPHQQQESSSDSIRILNDFIQDEKEEQKKKEAQLLLMKKGVTRHKTKLTHQRLVGEEAVKAFYDRYKHIEKLQDKQAYYGQKNPITFILSVLDSYNLPPKRMQIIKIKGNQAILDLKNCGIGKGSGIRIISELVSHLDNFQNIDLSFNQIGQDSVQTLIPKLGVLKSVNLSHNKIGKAGCQLFADLFKSQCEIIKLQLEANNLSDLFAGQIIQSLMQHKKLRLLNLSKNLISNAVGLKLKKYLMEDECLEQLYLHWNEITDKGGKYIFDALCSNKTLRVLDISWNALTGREAVSSICQFFQNNKTLMHLDIAFCDFNTQESTKLSTALEPNNTIYGIHFQGNMGYVNHRCGIVVEPGQVVQYPIPIKRGVLRRIWGVSACHIQNQFKGNHKQDVCWICQGWQQVYFKIARPPGYSGQCYLHLDFQNWQPVKMQREGNYFDTMRMCPLQEIHFYFTFQELSKEATSTFHEPSAVHHPTKPSVALNRYKVQPTDELFEQDFTVSCHCLPRSEVHVLKEIKTQTVKKPQVINEVRRKVKKDIVKKRKILTEEKVDYNAREVREINPEDSILNKKNKVGPDSKDFWKQCIQFDIANSKLFKVIKKAEDQDKFKQLMIENYYTFQMVYYYLCNNNVSLTGMYSISEFNLQQFIAQQKYESKRVTLAKIMLKLMSCLMPNEEDKNVKKDVNKPDKLTNRPQFLQFLVRLAQQKWCVFVPKKEDKKDDKKDDKKGAKEPDPSPEKQQEEDEQPQVKKIVLPMPLLAAIQRIIKSLAKYANRINPQYWRKKKYLTADCQAVYKVYQSCLQALYDRYAGSRTKLLKGAKVLNIDEMKDMFMAVDLKKTREMLKDCQDCFMDAKNIEFEEGIKIPTLGYLQFVEALARYADRLCFPPVRNDRDPLWAQEELRKKVPLFLKFQSLIIYIYRRMPEIQTRNMSRIVENGSFAEQADALLEIFKSNEAEMGKTTSRFLRTGFKLNTLFSLEDINLATLVNYLSDKYRDRVIIREEEIEEVEEVEEQIVEKR